MQFVFIQVLLVTTLLSLVTMFDTVRNNSPNALELKCIEVIHMYSNRWKLMSILSVFQSFIDRRLLIFAM